VHACFHDFMILLTDVMKIKQTHKLFLSATIGVHALTSVIDVLGKHLLSWVFLQELPNSIEFIFHRQPTRFSFIFTFVKYIHMTPCLGICPRTYAYLCFATNAEKGLRQVEQK